MEFILQALTYKEVGRIIYSSAHVDFNKAFADWRAAIAQGVDLIVTYPDFGDAMIPVMKRLIADARGDPAWRRVVPPFRSLPDNEAGALEMELSALGWRIGQT